VAVVLPTGRPYTVDDLDRFPDDGNRYEIIEGSLHVSPSPMPRHQVVVANLYRALHGACPPHLRVLFAPLDIVLAHDTVLQPDLLVVPADTPTDRRIDSAPLLVVEVLSPSTWSYDLNLKPVVYRRAGVGSFWAVDPQRPAITTWTWNGDDTDEARATAAEPLEATVPFPVSLTPAQLLA
jgi:Uma2 family endonuclease